MKKSPKPKTKKTKSVSTKSRTAAKSSSKKISKKTPTVAKSNSTKISPKNPKKSTGAVFFDKRLSEQRRFENITSSQWKKYVNDLKCAICGVPGGKCNCKPEDLEDEIENVQA